MEPEGETIRAPVRPAPGSGRVGAGGIVRRGPRGDAGLTAELWARGYGLSGLRPARRALRPCFRAAGG